ncbi:DUF2478 domain-containing protein [Bradyrhizobium sp. SYSU BS000235]|uniref:DUF2478 domain-containing protein n=1 Tax=Bradyrhizobium sp. SYSU BS000235 TaxID=3411332 RepID=UPI003C77455C
MPAEPFSRSPQSGCGVFDAQCDLGALVYQQHETPDALLRGFADDLIAQGHRVVGLVQLGHHCTDDVELSVMMLHNGEQLQLFQDLGTCARGCRLDVDRLMRAGGQIADQLDGADLLIINRFGKHEQEGKGLLFLVEQALSLDIPVLIAVPDLRFHHWIKFSGGMSVKLPCRSASLHAWWKAVSKHADISASDQHQTICEAFK